MDDPGRNMLPAEVSQRLNELGILYEHETFNRAAIAEALLGV